VLDPVRILVGSRSNFGAPLAIGVGQEGALLSIDPTGPAVLAVPSNFASGGDQASTLAGYVQEGATRNSMVIAGQPISAIGLWVSLTLCAVGSTALTMAVPRTWLCAVVQLGVRGLSCAATASAFSSVPPASGYYESSSTRGRTVTFKVKFANLRQIMRSRTGQDADPDAKRTCRPGGRRG
jgi:hypothetical protein